MTLTRRNLLRAGAGLIATGVASAGWGAEAIVAPNEMLLKWYRLVLELVRHTPTYSPPVASRAFAYLGVAAYEAVAGGNHGLRSLAGQLNGLQPIPRRQTGATYDDGVILNALLTRAVGDFFGNTGPTGQRALTRFGDRMRLSMISNQPTDVVARSEALGLAIAAHVFAWSEDDGGAMVENMGFPLTYELKPGPAHWVPTSLVQQQQVPLLPDWGKNRTFAIAKGDSCPLPAPPPYSEDVSSTFYREALEVYQTTISLTDEQKAIARFWSDDPMLSPTPPGHWMTIAVDLLESTGAELPRIAEVLSILGIALADSFIACWHSKFEFDLVRPVTYIQRFIDPKWQPMLITPPFPEYPSGHSTQSGAAAAVLTQLFGDNYGFDDNTHDREGMAGRRFDSFWQAAEEAGISRLYGGIHFRAAIERGLDQGRCVAAHANSLRTRA